MKNLVRLAILTATCALGCNSAFASSHREALAILNEPCADTSDLYAFVSPGDHSKIYLIANILPMHEPGQGNQGLRACNGYRYVFHIGRGPLIGDVATYQVEFTNTVAGDVAPSATDPLGGGNEILWQVTGSTEVATVSRLMDSPLPGFITGNFATPIGTNLKVAPNNHGPQTDRLINMLGPFQGYDSGNPESREVGLYNDQFIRANFIHALSNGGRFFAGQRDDPFYFDEKGLFDIVNVCKAGLAGIPGARSGPCEDIFAGFNVFTIALELPTSELFPGGIPHNGTLVPNSTDSLLRVWVSVERQQTQIVDASNAVTGVRGEGTYVQVGRQGLPLFNAGFVGTKDQTKYLRSSPLKDVSNFGANVLYPVLVRNAQTLGIYRALGIDPVAAGLLGPRMDIINAINLGRPIPVLDGYTGDVLTLDVSVDSKFPNGRVLGNGTNVASNKEQVDVSDVMMSLILAGDPAGDIGDGVDNNDKNYLTEFPFAALPHQGLKEGHGSTNQDDNDGFSLAQ